MTDQTTTTDETQEAQPVAEYDDLILEIAHKRECPNEADAETITPEQIARMEVYTTQRPGAALADGGRLPVTDVTIARCMDCGEWVAAEEE